MASIYLAARYCRYPEMQRYAKELTAHGQTVTSRWILGDHEIRAAGQASTDAYMRQWAQEDYEDLLAAEIVISFTEPPEHIPGRGRGGRHIECGIGLALQKRCIVVEHRENVFHWLPQVEFYARWSACLAVLAPLSTPQAEE